MKEAGKTSLSSKRLYIAAVDYARGRTGALVHFTNAEDYVNYEMLQGYGLAVSNDFKVEKDGSIKLIEKDARGDEKAVELEDGGLYSTSTGSANAAQEESKGFFAKILDAIKNFFAKIGEAFSKLFGGK